MATIPTRWGIPEQSPNALTDSSSVPMSFYNFMSHPGPLSQLSQSLANGPRMLPPGGGALAPGASTGGYLEAMPGGGSADPTQNDKGKGAVSGAATGYSVGGPWGALVGGVLGYGASGGAKDLNPLDASGFTGISMDQAWKDQNLARLGSNPGGALVSKAASGLGIDPESTHGKVLQAGLDPVSFLGGLFRGKHGDEKRNLNAFTSQYPLTDAGGGMYALPDGTKINSAQLKDLAGTWYGATYAPDGNQADWQDKFNELLGTLYSQAPDFGG